MECPDNWDDDLEDDLDDRGEGNLNQGNQLCRDLNCQVAKLFIVHQGSATTAEDFSILRD